jgi:hypothetical protein
MSTMKMGPSDAVQNKDISEQKLSNSDMQNHSPRNSPGLTLGSPKFSMASSLSDPDMLKRGSNSKVSKISLKLPPLLEATEGNRSEAILNVDFRDDKSI